MSEVCDLHAALTREVGKALTGQENAVRLLFIALCCEGHVLIEGVPGVAKTTLARALGRALGLTFRRVQFTADLMPSDILGTQIFDFREGRFHLVEGPVFTNLLLADEINRAPAKTQAALLEAMQERQVSIEGHGRALPQPFLVVATQNPVEQHGTYPLPEAQLDRFLFKIVIDYPTEQQEEQILEQHRGDTAGLSAVLDSITTVTTAEGLAAVKEEVMAVQVRPEVGNYVVKLVRQTRDHVHLHLGGSPRASVLLQLAARAAAALDERSYVIPDDVKSLFVPTLRHRVVLSAAAEVEGLRADELLTELANAVAVPR